MKDKLPYRPVHFLFLAAGIVTAGCLYYGSQQDRYRTEVEHKLAAVADLKVGELSLWRKERLGDAGILFKNSAFSALVRRSFGRPEDLNLQEEVQTWISHFQASYLYAKVAVLDAQGGRRIRLPTPRSRFLLL